MPMRESLPQAHLGLLSLAWMLVFGTACGSTHLRPAFEPFDPAVTPSAEDYPDVPAVVLLDRGTLTMTADLDRRAPALGRLRIYRRLKVLREAGRVLAEISIPYDPGSALVGLIARSVAPEGGTREITLEEASDVSHESGRRAKRFTIPEVRIGTILEYSYDLYLNDLRFVPPWVFQASLPVLRSEYAVVVPKELAVDFRFTQEGTFVDRPPERFDTDEGTRFFWSETAIPPRFFEQGMPSATLLSPRAQVILLHATIGGHQIPGFSSWDEVSRWLFSGIPAWDRMDAKEVAEAKRIAGDAGLEEQALRILESVARDLAWDPGPHVPLWRASIPRPVQILSMRRGNEASRGLLLVALLRAAGITNAIPALVVSRGHDLLTPDIPTIYGVEGLVAVIPGPARSIILDPSQLTVSVDVPSPRLQGTRIVALHEDGAEVLSVPLSEATESRTRVQYDLRMDPRGEISGEVDAKLTGAEAGALRERLQSAAPEQYAELVSSFIGSRGAPLPVESLRIADLGDLRRPLTFKGQVATKRVWSEPGSGSSMSIGAFVASTEPTLPEVRRAPLLLDAPHEVDVSATLSLPTDHEPEDVLPEFDARWFGGRVQLTMRKESSHRLGFSRRAVVTAIQVSVEEHAEYRKFRETVRDAEARRFSVKRPPVHSIEY